MDERTNFACLERLHQLIAPLVAYDIQVVYVFGVIGDPRRDYTLQTVIVDRRDCLTALIETIEVLELDTQNCGLQFVEAAVATAETDGYILSSGRSCAICAACPPGQRPG